MKLLDYSLFSIVLDANSLIGAWIKSRTNRKTNIRRDLKM